MSICDSYDECDGCEYNWGSCNSECEGDSNYEAVDDDCASCGQLGLAPELCDFECTYKKIENKKESVVIDISTIRGKLESLRDRVREE